MTLHVSKQSIRTFYISKIKFEFITLNTETIGSGHYPLRSSLKKKKNKDQHSITSESSSKRTRFAVGAEQTNV